MDLSLGKRIRQVRQARQVSQQQLAAAVGVSKAAVAQWESGATKAIEAGHLLKAAECLDVTAEWLQFGEARQEAVRRVPLVSWVRAGLWSEADAYAPGEAIATTARTGPRAFALRVRGDSMEPRFAEGCVIIVDPDREYRSGSFIVARLDDAHEATFKQLILDGGRRYLKPLNPRYPILEVDRPATIVGVVVRAEQDIE